MLKTSFTSDKVEAGCDEAGRGCLAGPVVAAAVILPSGYENRSLNDSKQLSGDERMALREVILREAVAWGIGVINHEEIDRINILNASFRAMHLAIDQLKVQPDLLLIDGNRFKPYPSIDHQCIVKGDAKFMSIAAASILAKTYRDELMMKLAADYPGYGWESNKGYPTPKHREGIRKFGLSPYHRKSFRLLPSQTEL
ncbi:MAG: ribonuclease HII, partial [Cyclobacteriaceae bacterium]|nr:ribonuclease HII [Cyclobacteriaceae bacterium]